MLTRSQLEVFSALPSPLVTAYVHTSSTQASLHGPTAASVPWLKDESRSIAASLATSDQAPFAKQVERIEEFLRERTPHEKSLVIFAGPGVWETVPLQAELQSELHWGEPAVGQLMWLVSEHRPYGLVAVDHAGARFFQYWFGQIVEYEEKRFDIDVSQWKRKELGHVTGQGVRKTRGTQRDFFNKRMDSRYAHICREMAQQAVKFCTRLHLAAIFLVGPERLIKPIGAKFPKDFQQPIVLFEEDLVRVTALKLLKQLEPQITYWERRHEAELVAAVTSERGTVVDFDETLAQLQKGKIRTVVLARGIDPILRQCVQCGWADRTADPVCPICGSDRRTATLQGVLPALVRRYQADIEVVSDQPAESLKEMGGMAGWLQQRKGQAARNGR